MGFLPKKKYELGTLDFTNEQYQRLLKEAVSLEAGNNPVSGEGKVVDFSAGANSVSSPGSSTDTTASAFSFLDNLAGAGANAMNNSTPTGYPEMEDSKARVLERVGNKLTELDNRLLELMNRLEQVELELRRRYN